MSHRPHPNPRFSLFLRAIGLKPGFRRGSGPSSLFSIGVAALVGVASGHYIFHEPLQAYWKEQQQLQEQEATESKQVSNSNGGQTATGPAAVPLSREK
jgi:hypothetical protein